MEIEVCKTGIFQVNSLIVPVTNNYCFVTDIGGHIEYISSVLEKNNLTPIAVILTHGHFDHILGLADFCQKYPLVKVAIHSAEEGRLGKLGLDWVKKDLYAFGMEHILPKNLELPKASILLEEGNTLSNLFTFDGEFSLSPIFEHILPEELNELKNELKQWEVLSTPGHTPGSICLYNLQREILISGDTLFYLSFGRTDLEGGNESQMKKSLSRLYSLPPTTLVYPGHDIFGFPLCKNL